MVGTVVVEQRLASEASSVGKARRLLRAAAAEAGVAEVDWVDDALLVVSEVVTNALVHAGTPINLTVRIDGSRMRVEVSDGSRHLPCRRSYAMTAGTGRGLGLVEELVHAWGTDPHEAGKVVWFEVGGPGPEGGTPDPAGSAGSTATREAEVVLLEFPLLTHAAWQEHAAALLREHLLAALDEHASDASVFAAHAAAGEAMTVLFEQVPAPVLDDEPEALMASAIEPGVTGARLVLVLRPDTVDHFAALDRLLDAAAGLADTGAWLTAPPQPEIRALRRWICAEVERQAAGAAPVPWQVPEHLTLPPAPAISGWDPSVVTTSERMMVAADDTDRIVAVSSGALGLLGYDDADQLVGERLLSIIPWRYHQAHLAGITLHLTNGRAPLMDRTVTVPVLRRDGTEELVDLVVSSVQLAQGRRLFTAELEPHSS